MGLYSGAVSLERYKILGLSKNLKISFLNKFIDPYRSPKFKFKGASSKREDIVGWVRPPLDADLGAFDDLDSDEWTLGDCRVGDVLVLRFRIERRKVPTQLLQLLTKSKVFKRNQKRAKPLSRQEKLAVHEETKLELMEQVLPVVRHVDVMWDLNDEEVYLFSASKKDVQHFEELFFNTFCDPLKCMLVKLSPPLFGFDDKDWEEESLSGKKMNALLDLIPASFV